MIVTEKLEKAFKLTPGKWEQYFCETYSVDGNKRTKIPDSELNPMWVSSFSDKGKETPLCVQARVMSDSHTKNWKYESKLFAQSKRLLIHAIMVKLWFEDQYESGRISGDDFLFSKELIESSQILSWEEIKELLNE